MIERDQAFDGPNYNAVLPAAGAFTDQAYQTIPPNRIPRRLSILCTYTLNQSATNNQAKLRVQWKIGNVPGFYETFIDTSNPTIGAPYAELPEYAMTLVTPEIDSTTSPFLFRALSLEVPSGASAVRVIAAESGDTTHPGTMKIELWESDAL